MNELSDRLARLEAQPQGLLNSPATAGSESTKDEHTKRIQQLQIWVQALNGGTSALVDPRSWKNPILGVQAEQTNQRAQWEELHHLFGQLRNQHHGLLKDIARQQDKFDRLPIETLEEKYRKLETRIGEIQRVGIRPIRDKITSSGLDSIQSTPIQFDSTCSNPMHSDSTKSNPGSSNPVESNAIRSDPIDSNPRHGIGTMPSHSNPSHDTGSMPFQSNPTSLDYRTVNPPPRSLPEKVEYLMKHLECLDRHVTKFEQAVEEQLEQHEATIKEVSDHSITVALSHNQVTDHVNHLLNTVEKMQRSWDTWAEWTPVDQGKRRRARSSVTYKGIASARNSAACVGLLITDLTGCYTSTYTGTGYKGCIYTSTSGGYINKSVNSRVCMFATCTAIFERSNKNLC